MTVAYQGQRGAFGHEACLQFAPDHEALPSPSFAAVISAVLSGEADLGMLPVENSRAGPVPEVRDLIAANDLTIEGVHALSVRMHLLALPGATLAGIRTVVSHTMALAQCADSLVELGVATEARSNTAIAACALAAGDDHSVAVLASETAATLYGLNILRRDMQDDEDNTTIFHIVGRPAR